MGVLTDIMKEPLTENQRDELHHLRKLKRNNALVTFPVKQPHFNKLALYKPSAKHGNLGEYLEVRAFVQLKNKRSRREAIKTLQQAIAEIEAAG